MILLKCDLFDEMFDNFYNAVCVTTNGIVKNNGEAVMGKGCALQFAQTYLEIPKVLGTKLKTKGNHCHVLKILNNIDTCEKTYICSFPTKHNWKDNSDLALIEQSCKELVNATNKMNWKKVLIPIPGVGNGKLYWVDVKQVLEKYLDDRFYIAYK